MAADFDQNGAGKRYLGKRNHSTSTHTHPQGTSKSISAFVPERKIHTHTDTLEKILQILRKVETSEKSEQCAKNYIFIRGKEKAHTRVKDLDSVVKVSLSFAC